MDINKLTKISEQVFYIIQSEVAQHIEDNDSKETLNNLIYDLQNLIREAEDLVIDFKEQNLSINTIEAEGYLRAMLTVKSVIELYNK